MPTSEVTDGMIATIAKVLSSKIGRKVLVHHSRYQYKQCGKMVWSPWRYSITISGVHPSFLNMNANEVKSRLSMLLDLCDAGVIKNGEQNVKVEVNEDRSGIVDFTPGGDDSY